MEFLENVKSKVSDKNKTIYGILMIVLGIIIWAISNNFLGIIDILIIMIPSILLVIPYEKIRNNKFLGIILAIILIVLFIFAISNIFGADRIVAGIMSLNVDIGYINLLSTSKGTWNDLIGQIIFVNALAAIYALLNLVSCFMLTVQTKKSDDNVQVENEWFKSNHSYTLFLLYLVLCEDKNKHLFL